MSERDELAQKRDAIIERIKQVFPKKPKSIGKKATFEVTYSDYYPAEQLREVFSGKLWMELVDYPGIRYYMSDIDYAGVIHDKAYLYYLPTYLIITLKTEILTWEYYSLPFERILRLLPQFTLDQLETLIAYFEFQIGRFVDEEYWYTELARVEDTLLHLMIRRDELAKEQAK